MQRTEYNVPNALIVRIAVVCALAVWTTSHWAMSSWAAEPEKGGTGATAAGRPSAAPAYPLKVIANCRYLVDQHDAPFLLTGDSTQALTTNISTADAEMFFADRQAHGFNADWVNLLTAGPDMAGRNDGSTYDGIRPFTGYLSGGTDWNHYDLTMPNEAFFARVDEMIRLAAKHKILIILDPAETIAWLPALLNNGPYRCRAFGQYLGSRYKGFDNILWMSGNDFDRWRDPKCDAVATAVALGIKDRDTRHIHTAELHVSRSLSTDDPKWAAIVALDAAYCYGPPYVQVLRGYNNRAKTIPVFMVEAVYEFEGNAQPKTSTPWTLRRQEYWSLLSGATGQLYGNGYTWPFKPGWKSHLDTPGAEQMAYLKSFFESRPWYKLIPDQTHSTLTAGYGTMITDKDYVGGVDANDYATAARTADGSLVLAYLPTRRMVTIDMTRLSGPAGARWFDPSNGVYSGIAGSPMANTGSRTFTPPGNNHDGDGDWVLALEATAAAAPAFSTESYAKYGQLMVAKMESAPFPHPKRADGYKYNGKIFTAQESYSDNSVAVFIPKGFRATKRIDCVVHFHGWTGRLENVLPHYQLIEQFAASGRNAVLVVPQGPRGATDSFGGKLEDPDGFKRFMDEVLLTLKKSAGITPDASVGRVILSGHSGGGRVIAKILAVGGMTRNVSEVWLFDAMYSDAKGYMAWQEEQRGRLLNIYTDHGGTKANCEQLMADLRRRRFAFSAMEDSVASPADIRPRLPIFLHTALAHDDVLQGHRTFRLFLETSVLETIAAP